MSPRGDGRKPGEKRYRREGSILPFGPDYSPKWLEARRRDYDTIKDKRGYHKPGSQNPCKS